jgi:hypothetical protein
VFEEIENEFTDKFCVCPKGYIHDNCCGVNATKSADYTWELVTAIHDGFKERCLRIANGIRVGFEEPAIDCELYDTMQEATPSVTALTALQGGKTDDIINTADNTNYSRTVCNDGSPQMPLAGGDSEHLREIDELCDAFAMPVETFENSGKQVHRERHPIADPLYHSLVSKLLTPKEVRGNKEAQQAIVDEATSWSTEKFGATRPPKNTTIVRRVMQKPTRRFTLAELLV